MNRLEAQLQRAARLHELRDWLLGLVDDLRAGRRTLSSVQLHEIYRIVMGRPF